MSNSNQPQFRYTQTPSKVLHLRNLPWECIEEELVELCKPFGKIVNTKCNVGANRNQAFVEFVDLNQAINMVSYYASSSEPASIRGKHVYIQYSNRHEIVNNKGPGDVPGNVLLVTIEGVEAGDVSIDVIHLVFSAFGFVHKIATFEKAAGFQALIQFTDAETALSAREALDGRSIPRYLLPEHVGSCNLRISYSAHTDLNIKFQSHRSRDYTNPYLPVNATAIEGFVQPVVGPDGKKKEPESNVLLASIENRIYDVTVDVLNTVFSAFGTVQKIAIFEKNGTTQALIQYPDINTAAVAKDALEGHCIYDGGYCKLHISYSRHTDLNVKAFSDKSRDYTVPDSGFASGIPAGATVWQNPHAAPVFTGSEFSSISYGQPQGPPGQGPPGHGPPGHGTAGQGPPGQGPPGHGPHGQGPPGQTPSWDPAMQLNRPSFVSGPTTVPGQTYVPPPGQVYNPMASPTGSSPLGHSSQINPSSSASGVLHGNQLNMQHDSSSPHGHHPPYYR
ncbi:polypyrimidine tract-binding protein homolog 1-like isoform X1 [Apium graveolens]|uniref:polypyrimidine tract-binding protein homolog 1-like isoform X1 n=1 Tax=Apium graveolens TaxID=4045 RepID=UPI003D79651F